MLRVFIMSKNQALWRAAAAVGVAIFFVIVGISLFTDVAVLCAIIYGAIWVYKYQRDQKLIASAQDDLDDLDDDQLHLDGTTPPQISSGSARLFVPGKHPEDR